MKHYKELIYFIHKECSQIKKNIKQAEREVGGGIGWGIHVKP